MDCCAIIALLAWDDNVWETGIDRCGFAASVLRIREKRSGFVGATSGRPFGPISFLLSQRSGNRALAFCSFNAVKTDQVTGTELSVNVHDPVLIA